jgi:DNA invertase Pin-like site-specific DNA recombinase
MNLDGYIRVSRVGGRDGDSFISPDVQREQIERWANSKGATILTWHTDLDQSGAKSDRPGLTAALERVEHGETGGIVVAKLDRFSRSLTGALSAIKRLDDAGGQVVALDVGLDPTTPMGKAMRGFALVLAELQLDQTREQWSIAQQRAVKRGVHVASRTPTGYVRRKDGTMEPHPGYAPAIAEAFRMRAGGASWPVTAAYLDEQGVVGPYGNRHWTPRAVQHIIRNRVYIGEARSGRHVNREAHKPIIDRATWEAAQVARGTTSRSDTPALLSGLLRCAGCRYVMKPDKQTLRSGERVRIYRCRGDHAAGRCEDRAAVIGSLIEPHVERVFFELVGELTAAASANGRGVEQAGAALRDAEAELAAYRDNERISDVLGEDRYVEGLGVKVAAVEGAQRTYAEAASRSGLEGIPQHAELRAVWPQLAIEERQHLLASVLDAVFIRSTGRRNVPVAERVLVFPTGEAPDDLPRRGHRVPLAPLPWPDDVPSELGVVTTKDREESTLQRGAGGGVEPVAHDASPRRPSRSSPT